MGESLSLKNPTTTFGHSISMDDCTNAIVYADIDSEHGCVYAGLDPSCFNYLSRAQHQVARPTHSNNMFLLLSQLQRKPVYVGVKPSLIFLVFQRLGYAEEN